MKDYIIDTERGVSMTLQHIIDAHDVELHDIYRFGDTYDSYSDADEMLDWVYRYDAIACDFDCDCDEYNNSHDKYEYIYDLLSSIQDDAQDTIRSYEKRIVEDISARLHTHRLDNDIIDLVMSNFSTAGTASIAYIDALDDGDTEYASELLDRMLVSHNRHNHTDYDLIDKKNMTDEQVASMRRRYNNS